MTGKGKILFFILILTLCLIGIPERTIAGCACKGTAIFKCKLDQAVASGSSVTCSINSGYYYYKGRCWGCADGSVCNGAIKQGSCTITAGNNSCSVAKIDCGCSYFKAPNPSVTNGSVSFTGYSGSCSGYGYPYFSSGYHWLWLSNPATCTLNFNYTPVMTCTPSSPVWSYVNSSNLTSNSATLNWGLSSWGNECSSCKGTREHETHFYSGSTCSNYIQHWSFENPGLTYSYGVSGLQPGTNYSYRVYALNKCYPSTSYALSSCHTFTTPGGSCSEANPNNSFHACTYSGISFNTYIGDFTSSGTGYQYDWAGGGPNDQTENYSVRWQGRIYFADGNYKFRVRTDDGSRLYINNSLVIDKWHDQGPTDHYSDWIHLDGWVNIIHEYYENRGGAFAWLDWIKASEECDCPAANAWCSNASGSPVSTVDHDVSSWQECLAWCDTKMNNTTEPICQYNAGGPRNCWTKSAPGNSVDNCVWNTANPPFGAVWSGFGCDRPVFENPPAAMFSCDVSLCGPGSDQASCTGYQGCFLKANNQSTDPDNNIANSSWIIDSASPINCAALCDYTVPSSASKGNHNLTLTVTDSAGLSDSHRRSIYLKQDISADFVCSVNNTSWQACNSIDFRPPRGSTIYFHDALPDSILTRFGLTGRRSIASQDATISQRIWKNNEVAFNSGNNSNPSLVMNEAEAEINLKVTDTVARSASVTFHVIAGAPLPEWEEIIPIVWNAIKEKLAGLIFFWR